MTLSVVIVIASDTVRRPAHAGHLLHCLEGLRAQREAPTLDVVVPHLPGVSGLDRVAREFPAVRFLEVADLPPVPRGPYRDHHDDLRARGIRVTSGPVVAMLEDHEVPDPHWASRMMAAHAATTHSAVGGAIENGIDRPLNQAVCLCDFVQYLNPLPEGPSRIASDVNVSYKREALNGVFTAWRSRFNERRVHKALLTRGHRLVLSRGIVVYQRRAGLGAKHAIVERFTWGRSYAASRADAWGIARRLLYAAAASALPAVLVARIVRTVIARRRLSPVILASLPWVCLLSAAWALGESAGYVLARESKAFAAEADIETVRTS